MGYSTNEMLHMLDVVRYKEIIENLDRQAQNRRLSIEEDLTRDRAENVLTALRLKMVYAVYAGGLIETTKSFCRRRNNKVFKIEEIEEWRSLKDRPNTINYDPFIHLGGDKCDKEEAYCRHRLLFIPEEEAKRRRNNL